MGDFRKLLLGGDQTSVGQGLENMLGIFAVAQFVQSRPAAGVFRPFAGLH